MSAPVLRFAPSPNGPLHLGHVLSALTGFDMAQRLGGRFLVRIEDIDVTRCRAELVAGILDDLAWLGIAWEEPVLRQSAHFSTYRAAADRLLARGLLYPCFATRTDIAASATDVDPDGAPLNPGVHRQLSAAEVAARQAAGEPFALRIHMDRARDELERLTGSRRVAFTELDEVGRPQRVEMDPAEWGDAVVVRKDVPASYHLAVAVDDARQGVTHVTRGRDLYAATAVHRLLQVLLGLPEPVYHHHRLLTDAAGRKLSKSAGDTGLAALRAAGADPQEVRRLVGLSGNGR